MLILSAQIKAFVCGRRQKTNRHFGVFSCGMKSQGIMYGTLNDYTWKGEKEARIMVTCCVRRAPGLGEAGDLRGKGVAG